MDRADFRAFRWEGCLEAQLIDLELCGEIGIPHPDSQHLEERLLIMGGLGKAVCDHCSSSCVLQLATSSSTGIQVVSSRQGVTESCAIRQETQDPTF